VEEEDEPRKGGAVESPPLRYSSPNSSSTVSRSYCEWLFRRRTMVVNIHYYG